MKHPLAAAYLIRLRPLKGVDAIKALRRVLKFALRSCGLRCTDIKEVSDEAEIVEAMPRRCFKPRRRPQTSVDQN
jgi:hypothetical protein